MKLSIRVAPEKSCLERLGSLRAQAQKILHEGKAKLSGWRRESFEAFLAEGEELKDKNKLAVAEVYAAYQTLHEHYDNIYNNIRAFLRQVGLAAVALCLLLVGLVIYVSLVPPLLDGGLPGNDVHVLVRVILFGMMGALVSTVLPGTRPRLPDQRIALLGFFFRPVIGAVSAVAIYVFMRSGILAFGQALSPAQILAVAFASGFSDRLVLRAVGAVGGVREKRGATGKQPPS